MCVLPMFSGLPQSDQMKVFDRLSRHTRKVVVSTNIAETSITIDGIVYVVDAGFVKLPVFDSNSSLQSLVTVHISQASAIQRAGRAGRVRSGQVYRLYTEEAFNSFLKATIPEIQRSNMATLILQMKALGIQNVIR